LEQLHLEKCKFTGVIPPLLPFENYTMGCSLQNPAAPTNKFACPHPPASAPCKQAQCSQRGPIVIAVVGVLFALITFWGFFIMRNRKILRHVSKKYEHVAHKIVPPLAAGGSLCTTAASGYALHSAVLSNQPTWSFEIVGSVIGCTTGFLGICYGVYSMLAVRRMIRKGAGTSSDEGLGAMQSYLRVWHARRHLGGSTQERAEDRSEVEGALASDALIQRDFLMHAQRVDTRNSRRTEAARVLGALEVDPGEVVWHEDEPFAEGGFGCVWRVKYQGAVVAAKVLRRPQVNSMQKTKMWLSRVERECRVLALLSECPNIIDVIGIFQQADGAVVLMEYASGGTLYKYLHGNQSSRGNANMQPALEVTEQVRILLDIASAMAFCYAQKPAVAHRDLKPENILLGAHGKWLLADFGISKVDVGMTSTYTVGSIGTPAWSSPEQLNGNHAGEPSDVWSFGVIAWEVMTREVPWAGCTLTEVVMRIGNGGMLPIPELPAGHQGDQNAIVWREMAALLNSCWHRDMSQRASFASIVQVLSGMETGEAEPWPAVPTKGCQARGEMTPTSAWRSEEGERAIQPGPTTAAAEQGSAGAEQKEEVAGEGATDDEGGGGSRAEFATASRLVEDVGLQVLLMK
jgi:hypothetical protein